MSPQDTLLESIRLIVSVGPIPVGEKLKIIKTMNLQGDVCRSSAGEATKAREKLGLGAYNPVISSAILELGSGSDKDAID